MGINIGLDIGAISLKLAAIGEPADCGILQQLAAAKPVFRFVEKTTAGGQRIPMVVSEYRRIQGSPIQSTYDLLHEFNESVPETLLDGLRVTGSGSRTIAKILGIYFENEFKAVARAMAAFYPEVRTVFEMGGESARYIRLEKQPDTGEVGIIDYDRSGECAAGTGSFLDQQAQRMGYSVEEVGGVVKCAGCAARVAGRCSVFAKSDMIHAQQKGYSPAEILRGLCDAVARNFKSSIVKSRPVVAPVALLGGVALNEGVTNAFREIFQLDGEQLFVPELYAWCGAIGTALLEAGEPRKWSFREIHRLHQHSAEARAIDSTPLSMEHCILLRDRVPVY
ncbi:MAG: hypothetical protein NTY38_29060, partial [Acidobacteria bacterium]|nr:hypothetical protein [Acidobacteriota bacterium]